VRASSSLSIVHTRAWPRISPSTKLYFSCHFRGLLLCWKSVKCQHPWKKATSPRLFCSALSCGILAQVLLALPQLVIVGSGHRHCARTQPSGETRLKQHWATMAAGTGERAETQYVWATLKSTASWIHIPYTLPSACTLAIEWLDHVENMPAVFFGLMSLQTLHIEHYEVKKSYTHRLFHILYDP